MNGVQDPEAFKQLVTALEPWLDRVVIVGGWAHQLYRLHPEAQELDYPPLSTLDADVAVPAILPVGEEDIRARLLTHGFLEEFRVTAGHLQRTTISVMKPLASTWSS